MRSSDGCKPDAEVFLLYKSHACLAPSQYLFPGRPLQDLCGTVNVVASENFFFAKQATQNSCPSPGYVTLQAQPGQQIQVKLTLFSPDQQDQHDLGRIVEDGMDHAYITSTNPDGSINAQYTSKSHLITLEVAQFNHIVAFQGTFLHHNKKND